jgi:hypothetical protein
MESYLDKRRLSDLSNQFKYIYNLVVNIKNCSSYDKIMEADNYCKKVLELLINTFEYYKE